jgi:hypothetical protein
MSSLATSDDDDDDDDEEHSSGQEEHAQRAGGGGGDANADSDALSDSSVATEVDGKADGVAGGAMFDANAFLEQARLQAQAQATSKKQEQQVLFGQCTCLCLTCYCVSTLVLFEHNGHTIISSAARISYKIIKVRMLVLARLEASVYTTPLEPAEWSSSSMSRMRVGGRVAHPLTGALIVPYHCVYIQTALNMHPKYTANHTYLYSHNVIHNPVHRVSLHNSTPFRRRNTIADKLLNGALRLGNTVPQFNFYGIY